MSSKEYFDMAIIVPLEEELKNVVNFFPESDNISTDSEYRYSSDFGIDLRIIVSLQQDMGRSEAQLSASRILSEYDVGIIVSLGISGCLSSDLSLGDVCYTGVVVDFSDNSKAVDASDDGKKQKFSPVSYSTARDVTMALNATRLYPANKKHYERWRSDRSKYIPKFSATESSHPTPRVEGPLTMSGHIACGIVSASRSYNQQLLDVDRRLIAIDTESGGVFQAAASRRVLALTIRGISDFADGGKGGLEKDSKGAYRQYAAANAASFLACSLGTNFGDYLRAKRNKGSQLPLPLGQEASAAAITGRALQELAERIDRTLRERSPEYRLQPKGYHLPTPRIQKLDFTGPLGSALEGGPVEIREALLATRAVLIKVPRNYPDYSLPWVIADDLLTTEVSGKQAIPVVVDGTHFAPPLATLNRELADWGIAELASDKAGLVVFVVDSTPLHSRTRAQLLAEQYDLFPDAKFIFLVREEDGISEEGNFAARVSADTFVLCAVSFLQIANFLQKNFAMAPPESEVVALRLHETFDRFELSAHPSYFAGIPREIISALLQANRRSELIQLAVDGLLSFAVAGDKADVLLSRTTRARFLRKLAYAQRVDLRNFDETQIVAFAKEFAEVYDFEIDAIGFVQGFVSQGIIHFDLDKVTFSLSYVEAYLLALELREYDEAAIRYFSQIGADFDSQTFDIYCEIGPSPRVVAEVVSSIKEIDEIIGGNVRETNILLTDEIMPTYLKSPDRLINLQKRLAKAADDVRASKGDRQEKQRLIDIAEKVRTKAAEKSEAQSRAEGQRKESRINLLQKAVDLWYTGSILLGSSAEHLDAETKRGLAALLIALVSKIIDDWSRINSMIDFDKFKIDLSSDEFVRQFEDERHSLEEARKLVHNVLDILEFSFMAEPFRRTISWLCEQARHRVLRASLTSIDVSDPFERLVHALWLADIDQSAGRGPLTKAAKGLPSATFLRINLATHLLTRVYWSHWRQEDRLALLDAAEEILRPARLSFDKPELVRMVERSSSSVDRRRRRRRGGGRTRKKGKR